MKKSHLPSLVILLSLLIPALWVRAESQPVYSRLPVREVTIFKDGHAYVLHEGSMKTDDTGDVVMDYLPNPVMGTFWAYSAQPGVTLESVVSSRDELDVEHPSTSIEDLLKGNLGKAVLVKETTRSETYQATILRILEETSPTPNAGVNRNYQPPQSTVKIVLLKAAEGIRAVPVNQIQQVTFLDNPSDSVMRKESKDTMALHLDWNGQKPAAEATVGMAYVQLGIRWIPNYRVEIDGNGKAVLKLQGTIINELADLDDVKTHLVIGVPNFAFKDVLDPISFQEAVTQLSSHFRTDNRTAYAFSNAIMSQQAAYNYEQRSIPMPGQNGIDLGPELEGTGKAEDLFVFTLDHVTLKKGQRMVLPIAEFTLSYEDVYTVDIGFAPPLEMRRNFNSDQQLQLARLFHKPNAIHKIRLDNTSEYPLTTAPATIFKDGRILAQGMMTYTAIGNKGDLELTTAVNIGVQKADEQTNMTPNAVNWNGSNYSKIDMQGNIKLTNFGDKTVSIEVHRTILGNMDEAANDGTVKQLGYGYDDLVFEDGVPYWWSWCSWPWWWFHFNSTGQADWTVELSPKETVELGYTWHYYWN